MSFDAVTWAKAQKMPFKTAPARRRAKAVLTAFASYVDVRACGFAAVNVLAVETELEPRTVQRALADLKAAGFVEETGDQDLWGGKLYPRYRLKLERGPQNTRERLQLDRIAAASGGADCAVDAAENLSPQALPAAKSVTPRGDTIPSLRVTASCHPKEKDNSFGEENLERPDDGARTACAVAAETLAKGFPRKLPLLPRTLFDQVRAATGGDPTGVCDGYLVHCYWDAATRTLHPYSAHGRGRIELDLRRQLVEFNLAVGEPIPGVRR